MREEIIPILKQAKGFVSGEEISHRLRMSRAALWKHIEDLRRQGYVIEALPRRGYRFVSAPDRLLENEIRAGLTTKFFGKKLFCHPTIFSTMDEATRLAQAGDPEGTVVCAEAQTRGRGRMGREWVSPKGQGLYFSLILRPDLPVREVSKLTLMTAVALAESLRGLSGTDVKIKWPNDLLVRRQKLAGILTELSAEVERVKFVVVGIGINVNASRRQIPDSATSLKIETGKHFIRSQVLQNLLMSLENCYEQVKRQGFNEIFKCWRDLSATLGRRVLVTDGQCKWEGVAVDLADDGGLLIRDDNGKMIKRMSGDVFLKD